jgi:predicted DNA-binding transcriptional regulator AlpA
VSQKSGVENHSFKMPKHCEWLKFAANNAAINTKEVLEIFDITDTTLHSRINAGNFPIPDYINECKKGYSRGNYKNKSRCWKKETVVNEILRLQRLWAARL